MLENFHNSLKTLASMSDESNVGLLRPAVLRIDSFLGQAVEIMRAQSSEVGSSSSVVLEEQARVCRWGAVPN